MVTCLGFGKGSFPFLVHWFATGQTQSPSAVDSHRNFPASPEIHTWMGFTHDSRVTPLPASGRSKLRLCLLHSILCLLLLIFFYSEENWRGQIAWEKTTRALKSRDVDLNWSHYLPPPVPDDQNVFGVPEMQRWFRGGGMAAWTDFTRKLPSPSFPGLDINTHTARLLVAELTIGLPGTTPPEGFIVLRWDDLSARAEAARLLLTALGPFAKAPQSPIGVGLMLRKPDEIQPARIFLRCQSAPAEKQLQEFLPDRLVHANAGLPERVLKFEPNGPGSYRVTIPVLARAADFLAWSDGLEPQFALIRQALKRPCSQIPGLRDNPSRVPGPNFFPIRNLLQLLGARAQCHLLQGQPAAALDDLTFIHDFCRRVCEENQPMTLLAAMVNQAIQGLYAAQIAEGLRLKAWREPELAAFEERLKTIDVLPSVKQAYTLQAVVAFRALDTVASTGLEKKSIWAGLCPRGWGYRHMAARLQIVFDRVAGLDATNHVILPDKIEAADKQSHTLDKWSAYKLIGSADAADITRAAQVTAHNQTAINQARIACALERYHLTHGEYPTNLDALVPRFLASVPNDIIGGQQPHYRRDTNDTFVLYSIAWSGHDHGGTRGQPLPASDCDWVWPD